MSKKILGLDIQNDSVSAVLVRSGIKGNWLEAGTRVPIATAEPFDVSLNAAIQSLSQTMDWTGAVCIASIPANQVSFRNLIVPFKDAKKIRQILPFEIEPTHPIPVEDLIIDFLSVKQTNGSGNNHIITACVEKSFLESYLNALSAWNISPKIISVSGYAASACLADLTDIPDNCLMADINPEYCTLTVVISKQMRLIRSVLISRENESLSKSVLNGIQQTICAFDDMFLTDFTPDQILLTASFGNDAAIDEDIGAAMGIPVIRTDLYRDASLFMQAPASVKRMSDINNSAIGLAAIEIENIPALNFRKGPFALQKQWIEHKSSLIKTGALFGLLLIALMLNVFSDLRATEKKYHHISRQITEMFTSTFPNVTNIVDPLHQMRVAINDLKKTLFVPGEAWKDIRSIDIFKHISESVPKDIQADFTRLDIGDDSIQISGITDTFNSVDEIKNRLEQKNIFQKVTIMSANTERGGNRIQFKLKVQL